jgi:hypothetical protein
MTDRREGEPIGAWVARAHADALDLCHSASASDDRTTALIAEGRAKAFEQVAVELVAEAGERAARDVARGVAG